MDQPDMPALLKRRVQAPAPEHGHPENSILSVLVDEDEDVQWHVTYRDGKRFVTGYDVVKRMP